MNRALIVGVLCVAVGCSSSSEETKDGKANDQNAKQNAQQQTTAITSAMEGKGQAAADGLYTAGSSSQGTVSAQSFRGELGLANLHPLADPASPGCTCTGNSCTFKDCQSGSGSPKVNGTLSAEGGTFKCDLTWNTDASSGGQGSVTKIHVVADMTSSPTAIKGTLHTDGSVELKGVSVPDVPGAPSGLGNTAWTNDATWDVTVANKAPTAGSITYNGTYKVGSTTYTGQGSVKFP